MDHGRITRWHLVAECFEMLCTETPGFLRRDCPLEQRNISDDVMRNASKYSAMCDDKRLASKRFNLRAGQLTRNCSDDADRP